MAKKQQNSTLSGGGGGGLPKLHKWQTARARVISRKQIIPAPWNPRTIDRHARKRLRESLQADGLVETLVWNQQTGHLISGHQRLALLDEENEEGGLDYALEVSAISVDEPTERALNIRLNNPSLMGNYDFEGLQKLLSDPIVPLDPKLTGFDAMDLAQLFPDQVAGGMFDAGKDQAQGEVSQFKNFKPPEGSTSLPGEKTGASPEDIARMKEVKARGRKEDKEDNSTEFWIAFVAQNPDEIEEFLKKLELDPNEKFHPLSSLISYIQEQS